MNVRFKVYDSSGITLKYTFPIVFQANYPHSEKNIVEHTNLRGKGSIIIDGGETPWNLTLKGVLFAADYQALTVLIDDMETDVEIGTPYILRINKTESTYYEYKVKRIETIVFDETNLRTNFIEYTITFRVNSW